MEPSDRDIWRGDGNGAFESGPGNDLRGGGAFGELFVDAAGRNIPCDGYMWPDTGDF